MTPHAPPTGRAGEHVDWLLERFDHVPMTLLSWVRLVGDVWLVGAHPQWQKSAFADPLVIEIEGLDAGESMLDYFDGELDSWRESVAQDPRTRPFVLPVAPDRSHKANMSGGGPYGFILPDGCVDGLFAAETTMPFVSYLNWVFQKGGFPAPTGSDSKWRLRRALGKGLLPL